jgi:hypothetical protein
MSRTISGRSGGIWANKVVAFGGSPESLGLSLQEANGPFASWAPLCGTIPEASKDSQTDTRGVRLERWQDEVHGH